MLAKRDDSLLAVSVADTQGRIVHGHHTRPARRRVRTLSDGQPWARSHLTADGQSRAAGRGQ
jgi:hypothetical protein